MLVGLPNSYKLVHRTSFHRKELQMPLTERTFPLGTQTKNKKTTTTTTKIPVKQRTCFNCEFCKTQRNEKQLCALYKAIIKTKNRCNAWKQVVDAVVSDNPLQGTLELYDTTPTTTVDADISPRIAEKLAERRKNHKTFALELVKRYAKKP